MFQGLSNEFYGTFSEVIENQRIKKLKLKKNHIKNYNELLLKMKQPKLHPQTLEPIFPAIIHFNCLDHLQIKKDKKWNWLWNYYAYYSWNWLNYYPQPYSTQTTNIKFIHYKF
jgi:hypothetical protein